jgi:general secretion pathway protein L
MASSLAAGRAILTGFFDWWLGELGGLIPQRLRPAARAERAGLVLWTDGSLARLLSTTGGEKVLIEGALEAGGEALLGQALRKRRRRGRSVTVRLAAPLGLRRTLDLPLAAEGDLDQALQFEVDRITPFKASEVLFAYRVDRVDRAERRLAVALDVVPRAPADAALDLARRLQLEPERLELEGQPVSGRPLDLLPRKRDGGRSSRLNRLLLALLAVLAVAAVLVPLHKQRSTADELRQQVEAARQQAEKSIRLRDRLETMMAAANFVATEKRDRPMVGEVLSELTRVIPDQAYVSQLQLQDGTLQLHGFANTASELISRLSRSPLFVQPQFRSPVTRDPRNQKERFHIGVQIAGDRP